MKKIILLPIILGSVLLLAGGALFGYGIYKATKNDEKVVNTHSLKDQAINKFDIDLSIADLEFFVSDEENQKVVCEETKKDYHNVKVENETLYITHVEDKKWYEHIFNFSFRRITVSIYLPAKEYQKLDIDSSTGYIKIPHDFSFVDLNTKVSTGDVNVKSNVSHLASFKSSTGNITLNDATIEDLTIEASTGNVNLENLTVNNTIDVKTSTGNIKAKDVTAKDFKARASTGYVRLSNTIIANNINIKTSTGNVNFEDSDAATIDVKTDTGDVTGTLLTSKVFYVTTDTGRVNVPKSTTGGLCNIETDTGDVRISIKE